MIDQFLSYFFFSTTEIVILSVLFLFFLIQIYFYIGYYRKPYVAAKQKERGEDSKNVSTVKPKVSVIISSENEAFELSKNLPFILEQDYPDYEVIVVNNGSTDDSDDLLQSLKLRYPNLYHTYLPHSNDKKFGRRKLAFTIGIKAAKGDVLLFTEPYSKPASSLWISSMMDELTDDKDIVLGYSYYSKINKFFNRMARFDNLLYSMQYLASALKSHPYTGTYRNIAFRKSLFFENKGFASYLGLENGEDVFINQIITASNTSVAIEEDSFTETIVERFSLWKQLKKSYSLAKSFFRSSVPTAFGFEAFSRYIFYILVITSVVYGLINQNWAFLGLGILIFILRFIMQLIVINKASKYFKSGKFYFSLLVMDIIQPLYNLRFRTRHKSRV